MNKKIYFFVFIIISILLIFYKIYYLDINENFPKNADLIYKYGGSQEEKIIFILTNNSPLITALEKNGYVEGIINTKNNTKIVFTNIHEYYITINFNVNNTVKINFIINNKLILSRKILLNGSRFIYNNMSYIWPFRYTLMFTEKHPIFGIKRGNRIVEIEGNNLNKYLNLPIKNFNKLIAVQWTSGILRNNYTFPCPGKQHIGFTVNVMHRVYDPETKILVAAADDYNDFEYALFGILYKILPLSEFNGKEYPYFMILIHWNYEKIKKINN